FSSRRRHTRSKRDWSSDVCSSDLFSRAKSWDEAIATYRKALDLEPDDALTHYNLGLALKYKGDARQAAEEFEAVLRLKPKWADAHYGLGATCYDLRDLVTAQKELRTSVE